MKTNDVSLLFHLLLIHTSYERYLLSNWQTWHRANQTELMTFDLDKGTMNPFGQITFVLMAQGES